MKHYSRSLLAVILAAGMAAQAQDVISYTAKAAKTTGHATKKVAQTTGHGTQATVKKTADGTQFAAKKAGHGIKKGVTGTANTFKGN